MPHGGIVHVWGRPAEAKAPNEALCTEDPRPRDVLVIYHVRAIPMSDGHFGCFACGGSTKEKPDGAA